MYNNTINYNYNLYGEYRLRVLSKTGVVHDTGWCKNTILSSGLVALSSVPFSSALSYVDFGVSSSLSGVLGYGLNGVLSACSNPELINVSRDSLQTFSDTLTSKAYISIFATDPSSVQSETIREFAIKTTDGVPFARNVLSTPIPLSYDQSINFEYKLSTSWYSKYEVSIPFKTTKGLTFFIPSTSVTYNAPYDGVYYNNNILYLLRNTDELPEYGSNWPENINFAFNSELYSSFEPTTLSAFLNNSQRWMTVIDEYSGLQAPDNYGAEFNINTALLVKDGSIHNNKSRFLATRFKYPISLYDLNNISVLAGALQMPTIYSSTDNCFKKNLLSLVYKYTWCETNTAIPTGITSISTPISVFGICSTQTQISEDTSGVVSSEIDCGVTVTGKVNTRIFTYGNSTSNKSVTYLQLPRRSGYRVNFGALTGTPVLSFSTNEIPSRFTVVYNNVEVINTGFRGSAGYNYKLTDIGYSPVSGPSSGTATFTKSLTGDPYAYIYVDSPLDDSSYTFSFGCIS
jgi:hypothetical protein